MLLFSPVAEAYGLIYSRSSGENFSQGTNDSKNLRYETLYIGDNKYVNISSFIVLDIKLRLEENGDLNRNDPFKFIQSKAQN